MRIFNIFYLLLLSIHLRTVFSDSDFDFQAFLEGFSSPPVTTEVSIEDYCRLKYDEQPTCKTCIDKGSVSFELQSDV